MLEITFADHITAEMVEQDVFIEKTTGSGKVFRVTVENRENQLWWMRACDGQHIYGLLDPPDGDR